MYFRNFSTLTITNSTYPKQLKKYRIKKLKLWQIKWWFKEKKKSNKDDKSEVDLVLSGKPYDDMSFSTYVFWLYSYWEVCVVCTSPRQWRMTFHRSWCIEWPPELTFSLHVKSISQLRINSLLWCNKATIHVSPSKHFIQGLDHEDISGCPLMTWNQER